MRKKPPCPPQGGSRKDNYWLLVIGAALCFPLKYCCSKRSKFIFVCIFYAWTFLGLKRGRFLKICRDSNLKIQLQLVYSIVEHPKLQLQRVDGVVLNLKYRLNAICSIILKLKKHPQQEFCHLLKLKKHLQQEFCHFLKLKKHLQQD